MNIAQQNMFSILKCPEFNSQGGGGERKGGREGGKERRRERGKEGTKEGRKKARKEKKHSASYVIA